MIDEEKKYEKLINDLKNLPKVSAPQNFEADIFRKINSSEQNKRLGLWEKLISPGRLVPAAVAIASAIIVFFVVDVRPEEPEDPFSIPPRVREDVVVMEKFEEKVSKSKDITETKRTEEKNLWKNKSEQRQQISNTDNELMLSSEASEQKDEMVEEGLRSESLSTAQPQVVGGVSLQKRKAAPVYESQKENFNFIQINLTPKEKKEVEKLKQRVQSYEKAKSE